MLLVVAIALGGCARPPVDPPQGDRAAFTRAPRPPLSTAPADAFSSAELMSIAGAGRLQVLERNASEHPSSYCGVGETGALLCWEGPSCRVDRCVGDPRPAGECRAGEVLAIEPLSRGVTALIEGCVIQDKQVWCRTFDPFDFRRLELLGSARELQGSWWRGCARLEDGSMACWHADLTGSDEAPHELQMVDGIPLGHVTSFAFGGTNSCALLRGGGITCWSDLSNRASILAEVPPAIDVDIAGAKLCIVDAEARLLCGNVEDATVERVDAPAARQSFFVGESICIETTAGHLWCAGGPYPESGAVVSGVDAGRGVRALGELHCAHRGPGMACWRPEAPGHLAPYSMREVSDRCIIDSEQSAHCYSVDIRCPVNAHDIVGE